MKRALLAVILLGGCAVGPNYKKPEIAVADEWQSQNYSTEKPVTEWWKLFNDALLDKYVTMGAEHNNQLLAAQARILEVMAYRKVALSNLFPTILADFNAVRTYFSKNGPVFAIGQSANNPNINPSQTTGLPFTLQVPQIQNLFNALLEVNWEIDVFGKTRRQVEAADAAIGSAIFQQRDLLISILASIAQNYIEIRSIQKQLILIEERIATLEQEVFLLEESFRFGLVNKLDLDTVLASLHSVKASQPPFFAALCRNIYALSVLTGNTPERLFDELIAFAPLPKPPAEIAIGIRSDLIRRRPDIRRVERDLAQATAQIGVAVASFFPSFTFLGDGGFQSLQIGNLFQWGSRTYAFGGDMNIPLFQGGRLVGNLRAARAATQRAACNYQQSVLSALQEVESALVTYKQDQLSQEEIANVVLKQGELLFLTNERFTKGLVSRMNLLKSQYDLINSEESLLTKQTTALLDLILLYKSLGGGWEKNDP